jgi:pimeloyl-ACP methyl ester carboxylesterase
MLTAKMLLLRTLALVVIFYVLICVLLYFFQERLIFFPEKLSKDHRFRFPQPFSEVNIETGQGAMIHGLLFTASASKGLVFYLHGNAGSLDSWGAVAETYTRLGYDVFIPDYPGYGKSEGSIRSQRQLFEVIQEVYDEMKKRYSEDSIVVVGYSVGSGPASWLASVNHPKLLILQAPFYNMADLVRQVYPIVPSFLLKYTFRTNEYLKNCRMPVVLFHGDRDEVIYYGSSLKLQKELKSSDTLITLHGQGHNGMTDNPDYIRALERILQ